MLKHENILIYADDTSLYAVAGTVRDLYIMLNAELSTVKGNGDHSEVRDKFCSNFQNMLIMLKIWGPHSYKKVRGRHILIDKLSKP